MSAGQLVESAQIIVGIGQVILIRGPRRPIPDQHLQDGKGGAMGRRRRVVVTCALKGDAQIILDVGQGALVRLVAGVLAPGPLEAPLPLRYADSARASRPAVNS